MQAPKKIKRGKVGMVFDDDDSYSPFKSAAMQTALGIFLPRVEQPGYPRANSKTCSRKSLAECIGRSKIPSDKGDKNNSKKN